MRRKKIKPETLLTERLANYIRMHYPDNIFRFDLAADMPLPQHLAKRGKQLHGEKWNRGYPDLFVAACRKGFGGLYLELKAGKTVPNTEHTRRQAYIHQVLRESGYHVSFCCGFEECVSKLNSYMKRKRRKGLSR